VYSQATAGGAAAEAGAEQAAGGEGAGADEGPFFSQETGINATPEFHEFWFDDAMWPAADV